MSIAVSRHMEHLERTIVVNSDMFAADKRLVDSLRRPDHHSHPGAGFGVKAETDAVIGNPMVVARGEETIGIFNNQPVLLSACQLNLTGYLLESGVASVMIGIGVGVDCQGQARRRDANLFEEWSNRVVWGIRRAGVEQNYVVTYK